MGSSAHARGVVGSERGGTSRVEGLDVKEEESATAVEVHEDKVRPVVELGLTSGGPPLVQGSLAAREVSKDAVRTPDRVTERGKGSKGRVVGNSLLQEAVGTADKVPAVKGDSAVPARGVKAVRAHNGTGGVSQGWAEEEVNGEGRPVGVRVGEGEERYSGGVRGGGRDATPEGKGTTGSAAVKKAGLAGTGGGRGGVEGEERARRDDCRGGLLGVWVARRVALVQVKEERGRVRLVGVVGHRALAEGNRGRREAAVDQSGVEVREAGVGREEGKAGVKAARRVSRGQARPSGSDGLAVAPTTRLSELLTTEGGDPAPLVVPDTSPGAVVSSVVVGSSSGEGGRVGVVSRRGSGGRGWEVVAAKPARKGGEGGNVEVWARRAVWKPGEVRREHCGVEGEEGVTGGTGREGAEEVARAGVHTETHK